MRRWGGAAGARVRPGCSAVVRNVARWACAATRPARPRRGDARRRRRRPPRSWSSASRSSARSPAAARDRRALSVDAAAALLRGSVARRRSRGAGGPRRHGALASQAGARALRARLDARLQRRSSALGAGADSHGRGAARRLGQGARGLRRSAVHESDDQVRRWGSCSCSCSLPVASPSGGARAEPRVTRARRHGLALPGGLGAPRSRAGDGRRRRDPLWFGQRGAAVRRIAGRVASAGAPSPAPPSSSAARSPTPVSCRRRSCAPAPTDVRLRHAAAGGVQRRGDGGKHSPAVPRSTHAIPDGAPTDSSCGSAAASRSSSATSTTRRADRSPGTGLPCRSRAPAPASSAMTAAPTEVCLDPGEGTVSGIAPGATARSSSAGHVSDSGAVQRDYAADPRGDHRRPGRARRRRRGRSSAPAFAALGVDDQGAALVGGRNRP